MSRLCPTLWSVQHQRRSVGLPCAGAQRHEFGVRTHLRENRRGRTGLDSAYVLHATERGSDFARGETWAVHVAWSGNHRHVAEHDSTGIRAARSTSGPGSTRPTATDSTV
ncbi:glycoside hydrolase family 36 N-terminal domain-containing protein [Streptomyces sp. SYSU K217416]